MPQQPGSRKSPVVNPPRALAYLVGALNGLAAGSNKTVQVSRQFKGISPILVSAVGTLPAGVTISAHLVPPNPGDYANGIAPTLQISTTGTGSLSGDLLIVQT